MFSLIWEATKGSEDTAAKEMADQAVGGLTKLLAVTGRLAELDALEADLRSLNTVPRSQDWWWGMEFSRGVRKYPQDSYKCGLYCLDQLGRLTQLGEFSPHDILETGSSANGFTAAELVQIGQQHGVRVRAAFLADFTELPVPCVVHLRSKHFVVVRERDGDFYEVLDPVAYGRRWLKAEELAEEATGCVLVSQLSPSFTPGFNRLVAMDAATAANFRGRCHAIEPYDTADCGTCPPPDAGDCPDCPPGAGGPGGGGGGGGGGGSPPGRHGSGDGSPPGKDPIPIGGSDGHGGPSINCMTGCGAPYWTISEPYQNLWLYDTPLSYSPAYGPDVSFHIAYNGRRAAGPISTAYYQGARVGSKWTCSWLSHGELDASGNSAEVMLPVGGWALFTFSGGATNSSVNYKHNLTLEKMMQSSTVIGLRLKYRSGAFIDYTNKQSTVYFMTGRFDPAGNKASFTYSGNLLTNVTAADGVSFTLSYKHATDADIITSVSSSYGASVTLTHGETGPGAPDNYPWPQNLTTITDAEGITSHVWYPYPASQAGSIVTPYGTTRFEISWAMFVGDYGVFDRLTRVTHPDSSQEFFGLVNQYAGMDFPAFANSQIPTNTPVGTLDTASRKERNTFYWNRQQFASYVSTNYADFNWNAFKKARIRHWLASTVNIYTHYDTLSIEQDPSPDGSTEGQLTWYDYVGKPVGVNYERGSQVMPSVVAKVMPDGSTWYENFTRNSIGKPTQMIEKWVSGASALYRTNSYTYSSDGIDLLENRFDPSGANKLVVGYGYNGSYPHQAVRMTNALGEITYYTYDNSQRLTSVQTPGGLLTTNVYGGDGFLSSTVDSAVGGSAIRTNSYTWSKGLVLTHTDERGLKTTNTWDGLRRLTRIDFPDTTYIKQAYTNGSGTMLLNRTFTKDRLGFETRYEYNGLRQITKVTDARTNVTAYGYCTCGTLEYITNAFGSALAEVTHYVYDYRGLRVETYFADSTSRTNRYDLLGRPAVTSDALGSATNTYDNLSRLVTVSNYFGQLLATTYDVENHPIYVTDANGVTITNTYDNLDRLLTRTYPDTGAEKFGYSALGLVKYTNQLNLVTSVGYDAALRKTVETNANSEIITYTYNAAGDLKTLTDGKTNVTTWNYDEYGRVTNKVDQASVEILRYKYDADSRLTNRWSKAKGDTAYLYDSGGNLTKVDYPAGTTDITLSYDALNRVTNMVDAAGTTAYAYYAGGNLWTEDGPWSSDTVTNLYNNARLRSGLILAQPTGTWTNGFGYDAAHRVTNVTSTAGTFSYTYKGVGGLVQKISLPNTSYITNVYDSVARLTSTKLNNNGNANLNKHEYLYNAGNQRIRHTRTDDSYYTNTYDNIGQLKVADSTVASEGRFYGYDAGWNLAKRTNNTTVYTFGVNVKNELTSGPTATYGYDDNGNLTSSSSGYVTYTYDAENQLVTWQNYNTAKTDFVYDGRGRLRKRLEYTWMGSPYNQWSSPTETRYVYDGMRVIQERNSGNTPTVAYTRGSDLSSSMEGAGGIGGLLSRSHAYQSGSGSFTNNNYYHSDGGGNVTYMVDTNQANVATYRYDPYGNQISSSGGLASANVYRFSSKEIHINSLLYYYGYRFYDPNLQRWLNRDPADDWGSLVNYVQNVRESEIDLNLYRFVGNSPAVYVDEFGLKWRAGGKWDGKDDTIVCDGKDGIRVALCKNSQGACGPGKKCRMEHEMSHAADALAENPDICKGKKDGTQIYTYNKKQLNASERKAYDKEIDCIKQNAVAFDKECSMSSADYIKQIQKNRKRYE
jgi:RHS repeat-associated protein